ncbi:MAG: hypothetical protein ACKO7Z_05715 [Cyanobacteriota bacterium]
MLPAKTWRFTALTGSAVRCDTVRIRQGWQRLVRWVLDQPPPAPPLLGQCCDRLRPGFMGQALELELEEQQLHDAAVVDWRWDGRSGQIKGLLWHQQRLEHFHWLPGLSHLVRQPVLELERRTCALRLGSVPGRAAQG